MSKTFKIVAEVEIPKVPNFLRMTDGQILPVSAATEESLQELGKLWTEALIARAKEQKEDEKTYCEKP